MHIIQDLKKNNLTVFRCEKPFLFYWATEQLLRNVLKNVIETFQNLCVQNELKCWGLLLVVYTLATINVDKR